MKNKMQPTPTDIAKEVEKYKKPPNTEEMLQVARWFYKDELAKEEIARRLGKDVRHVRRLLRHAKRSQIVRIDIYEPRTAALESLENGLLRKFGLHDVKVVPTGKIDNEDDYAALIRRWGFEAAALFTKWADGGEEMRVGISGGETLLEFVNAVPERVRENVQVFASALVGRGPFFQLSHVDPATNATLLWAKCGRLPGRCHYATVPPHDPKLQGRSEIGGELSWMAGREPIRRALKNMDDINVAFAGLGLVEPPPGSPGLRNRLSATGLVKEMGVPPAKLAEEGAIGDLGYSFFDDNGKGKATWRFFLTAGYFEPRLNGVEFYRQMVKDGKKVVVLAGTYKARAILTGLKAKLFNVLITDQDAARNVLDMS
jgi:DNA-binding transcriptional regulator LsrR (DeoR family)